MQLRFDEQKNIAFIIFEGKIASETIPAAFDKAVTHPSYTLGMTRLLDLRDADMSDLDTDAIREAARHSSQSPKEITEVKVAFVTNKDLEYGLSRMFTSVLKADTPTMVFRSMEKAITWLTSPS